MKQEIDNLLHYEGHCVQYYDVFGFLLLTLDDKCFKIAVTFCEMTSVYHIL